MSKSFKLRIPKPPRRYIERSISMPGAMGVPGPPGTNAIVYSAQADVGLSVGKLLYLKGNGHVGLAVANAVATSKVCGLSRQNIGAGSAAQYEPDGVVEQSNWTGVVGAASLVPGSTYYLSPTLPGQMTAIAPVVSGQLVTRVGTALSTTRFEVELENPILL